MRHEYLLLGPGGRSVEAQLPDDRPLSDLADTIARALDLPAEQGLVIRSADARLLDMDRSLSASRVDPHDKLLVELVPARPWFGKRPAPEAVVPHAVRVLPCYLVIDTSTSMRGQPINDINAELPRLQQAMQDEPLLGEICQLSLITFDVSARVHVKLVDADDMDFTPLLAAGRETNYAAPFNLLRRTIADDLYQLHLKGRRPYRPVVFFLSDGKHNGKSDWRTPLSQLSDRRSFHGAPNIIAFGFGDATEQTIRTVGRKDAYLPEDGGPAANLHSFMRFMLSSLTSSADNATPDTDDPFVAPPNPPRGWKSLRSVP